MAFSITNTFKARMVLCCIALSFFVWTVSAQVLDTINGTVTDSASNAAIDSVNVSSEGVSVKTNASGVFSLVVGATQVINPLETKNMPAVNWDPKNGLFSWSGLSGNVSISVRDVSGRVVTRYISTQGPMKHEVSLADLPQGVFLAEIRLNNQTVAYKIFHFQGESGNSLKTVYQAPNSSVSFSCKRTGHHEVACSDFLQKRIQFEHDNGRGGDSNRHDSKGKDGCVRRRNDSHWRD